MKSFSPLPSQFWVGRSSSPSGRGSVQIADIPRACLDRAGPAARAEPTLVSPDKNTEDVTCRWGELQALLVPLGPLRWEARHFNSVFAEEWQRECVQRTYFGHKASLTSSRQIPHLTASPSPPPPHPRLGLFHLGAGCRGASPQASSALAHSLT